jgi:hypothetical protein
VSTEPGELHCTNAVQVFAVTDVMAFAGHRHITTTMRYVHHVPQHDAAEKLDRAKQASGYFLLAQQENAAAV